MAFYDKRGQGQVHKGEGVKQVNFCVTLFMNGPLVGIEYTVVCCCKLNNTWVCDEHFFGQVSTCTGRNQLPISPHPNTGKHRIQGLVFLMIIWFKLYQIKKLNNRADNCIKNYKLLEWQWINYSFSKINSLIEWKASIFLGTPHRPYLSSIVVSIGIFLSHFFSFSYNGENCKWHQK